MKILVTGGAGFIGRWAVGRALAAGHEVVALDNLATGRRENVREFEGEPRFTFVQADITDRAAFARAFEQGAPWDGVLHLAASIHVQHSIDDPATTFRNDADGTLYVLEACRRQYFDSNGLAPRSTFDLARDGAQLRDRRPRIVMMSTCMVYERAADARGIDESHPLRPASPYAASKIAAESLSLSYFHAYRLPVTVVRPFNTYGPFQRADSEGGVVAIFLKRAIDGQPLLVKGDGTQTRDLLYVEDCADFLLRALTASEAEGQIVNAGTGRDIAIRDLAAQIGGAGRVQHVPHDHPQAEIPKLLCNSEKARRLLGWQPATSLGEGLSRTREWLAGNRWAW